MDNINKNYAPSNEIVTGKEEINSVNTTGVIPITDRNVSNLSAVSQVIDVNNMSPNKKYSDCESPLEFFIVSLCKNFEINVRQATALLSNNRKYLTILCYKGMKGNYSQVISWFRDISFNIDKLVSLSRLYEDGKKILFATIGVGIFSKSSDVSQLSLTCINSMIRDIGIDWDWFSTEGFDLLITSLKKHRELYELQINIIKSSLSNKGEEFLKMIKEKHSEEREKVENFFFFIVEYLANLKKDDDELEVRSTIIKAMIEIFIDNSIDKQTSMCVIMQFWLCNAKENVKYFDATLKSTLISFFKKNVRSDYNSITATSSAAIINLFSIMEYVALTKSDGGPLLYKTLVFLFLENYDNVPKREIFLNQFSHFFIKNQKVPIDIFLTPYLSQLMRIKSYSVCDMQFLVMISSHPRLIPAKAKTICEFCLNVALDNLLYARSANAILNLILATGIFNQNTQVKKAVYEIFIHYIEQIVQLYVLNAKNQIFDNAILETPYDIMLEGFREVNSSVFEKIVWAINEYRNCMKKHSHALLAMLWFYPDHDDVLLRCEEQYYSSIEEIDYKKETIETEPKNKRDNQLKQSVELVLKKIKHEKETKIKQKEKEEKLNLDKEAKTKKNSQKKIPKKNFGLGMMDPSNIPGTSLIQEEGSILKDKSSNITALMRPTSKMKLNTLIDFNQYNFIVSLNDEEPREKKAIEGYNIKYKTKLKFLFKRLLSENGLITKASILRFLREMGFNNNDITLDELSLCIRNTFNANINEMNQNQFKSLLITLSYLIMTKRKFNYTVSECYYNFLLKLIPNLNMPEPSYQKYRNVIAFIKEKINNDELDTINLPPGFKVVSKTDVIKKEKIPKTLRTYFTEGYTICIEIMNEIISNCFGNGIFENYIKIKKKEDVEIDLGAIKNWSNGLMIAYMNLPKENSEIGIEVADCLEAALRNLCRNGGVVQVKENKPNEVDNKKELTRLKRQKEIKEKVENYKREKEQEKQREILEKEKREKEKQKQFHEMVLENRRKNKKVMEEVSEYKKKKEEEKMMKLNEQKMREKIQEQKLQEEREKFFKNQTKKLKEQFDLIKNQKENQIKQKLEKMAKLPVIQKNYLSKDKASSEFEKNLIQTVKKIVEDDKDISSLITRYESHLKLIFDIYCKLGQNKISKTQNNNAMKLNEFKEFLVNFTVLGILVTNDQMNYVFKKLSRKNETDSITFDDFKLSLVFLNIFAKLPEKNLKIVQEDIDIVTYENIKSFFEYIGLRGVFEKREIENLINSRRGMSAKEFFSLQQKMKKEFLDKFKGHVMRNKSKSRPQSKIKLKVDTIENRKEPPQLESHSKKSSNVKENQDELINLDDDEPEPKEDINLNKSNSPQRLSQPNSRSRSKSKKSAKTKTGSRKSSASSKSKSSIHSNSNSVARKEVKKKTVTKLGQKPGKPKKEANPDNIKILNAKGEEERWEIYK